MHLTKLLAPATSKMTTRGGGKSFRWVADFGPREVQQTPV